MEDNAVSATGFEDTVISGSTGQADISSVGDESTRCAVGDAAGETERSRLGFDIPLIIEDHIDRRRPRSRRLPEYTRRRVIKRPITALRERRVDRVVRL